MGSRLGREKKASQGVGVSLNEEYSSKEVEGGLNSWLIYKRLEEAQPLTFTVGPCGK